jgi:hypothetical protein
MKPVELARLIRTSKPPREPVRDHSRSTPAPAIPATRQATAAPPVELGSLAFPERSALGVREIARKLEVTQQHVIDLIEEGALQAINVGSAYDSVRVPLSFLAAVAERMQASEPEVHALLNRCRAAAPRKRRSWRISLEAWAQFLATRHNHRDA